MQKGDSIVATATAGGTLNISTNGGDDSVILRRFLSAAITTGEGDDSISTQQTSGPHVIDSGSGDDTILAGGSDDVLFSGNGNDGVSAGEGDDIIVGLPHFVVHGPNLPDLNNEGGFAVNIYEGGHGEDIVFGQQSSDRVTGMESTVDLFGAFSRIIEARSRLRRSPQTGFFSPLFQNPSR